MFAFEILNRYFNLRAFFTLFNFYVGFMKNFAVTGLVSKGIHKLGYNFKGNSTSQVSIFPQYAFYKG